MRLPLAAVLLLTALAGGFLALCLTSAKLGPSSFGSQRTTADHVHAPALAGARPHVTERMESEIAARAQASTTAADDLNVPLVLRSASIRAALDRWASARHQAVTGGDAGILVAAESAMTRVLLEELRLPLEESYRILAVPIVRAEMICAALAFAAPEAAGCDASLACNSIRGLALRMATLTADSGSRVADMAQFGAQYAHFLDACGREVSDSCLQALGIASEANPEALDVLNPMAAWDSRVQILHVPREQDVLDRLQVWALDLIGGAEANRQAAWAMARDLERELASRLGRWPTEPPKGTAGARVVLQCAESLGHVLRSLPSDGLDSETRARLHRFGLVPVPVISGS